MNIHILKKTCFFLILVFSMAACTPASLAKHDSVGEIDLTDGEGHHILASGLNIDVYALEGPPELELLTFVPVGEVSQEEIFATHEDERGNFFPDKNFFDGARFCIHSQDDDQLTACMDITEPTDNEQGSIAIDVMVEDQAIYSVEAGDVSPITPLRGVWGDGEDWVLEYAEITVTINEEENSAFTDANGQLVRSGVLVNEQLSLDEAFGFQWIEGKPFYLFEKDGEIGISFDGEETMLGFDAVPHYACCSGAMMNPIHARNMTAFFAQQEERWFYVEVGLYDE